MISYTDQLLREVKISKRPTRIISFVPSITELLADLNLEKEIVGITKFCVHPESIFKNKTKVGGTKKIDHSKIDELSPDLIIASKEENTKEDIEILEKKYPVWISDVKSLYDAIEMISALGKITETESRAEKINSDIKSAFKTLSPLKGMKTLYLIWRKPFMAAGSDTFIHEMMKYNGMVNVITKNRYPELSDEVIASINPELILLSSEPYPFREKHITELSEIAPTSIVMLADGEYFSWYGSRLIGAPSYFNSLNNSILKSGNKLVS